MFLHRPLAINSMRSTGFTLIEMTVVLLLITLMASVAVRETAELGFQTRYEQTKDRLEMIRQAILGNPRQIINGQQAVSGFVADMGRLPDNLHELIHINGYCFGARGWNNKVDCEDVGKGNSTWKTLCTDNNYTDQNSCETNNATWLGRKIFGHCFDNVNALLAFDDETTCLATVGNVWKPMFYGGWNGPYLNISGNPDDADALTDGWGNQATLATYQSYGWTFPQSDAFNQSYGWSFFTLDTLTGNTQDSPYLVIQSLGKNQQRDNAIPANTDYENDFPPNINRFGVDYYPNPVVLRQDWLVDISGGIMINLLKPYQSLGGFCGFLASQANSFTTETDCKNAGGNWNGSSCTVIDASSCKSVGGKWQSCFFTSAQCSSFTDGIWQESCGFTQSSCDASGGTWSATDRICKFTLATCPASATWNGSACVFTENSCFNNRGTWQKQCNFDNQAKCEKTAANGGPGGTWNTDNPASCSFTLTQCNSASGLTKGKDCNVTNQEGVSNPVTRYSQQNCNNSTGTWASNMRQICLNIFYRDNGIATSRPSKPALIEENGGFQTVQFNFTNPPPPIPIGQNAIGIYEYDGDCDPDNNPLYPIDRQNPIQVDFHANTTLPVINW